MVMWSLLLLTLVLTTNVYYIVIIAGPCSWLTFYRVKVLPRSGLRKVEAKGLFANASVKRGRDWKWKDQDGE